MITMIAMIAMMKDIYEQTNFIKMPFFMFQVLDLFAQTE